MDSLQVTYYLNQENNRVKAIIQEKETSNEEYTKLKLMEEQINNSNFEEKEKLESKFIINANYYVKLMQEGYSYEQLFNALALEKKTKNRRKNLKNIIAISQEFILLEFAHQEKDTIIEYMSSLLGNTVVEIVEKDGIYQKRLFNELEKSTKNQIKNSIK